MTWKNVRIHYPNSWLLIEAIVAHTENNRRILDDIAILSEHDDSPSALSQYKVIHKKAPHREYFVVHTSREQLDIEERWYLRFDSGQGYDYS